jgi:gluconate 2-dehydrogenase gamma chain
MLEIMDTQNRLSRRHFVGLSILGAGSICLLPGCARRTSKWRFFTDPEALVMDAIAEQIIPTDDWPGGRDSGVTNFIDKQLTGPYTRFQDAYRRGIGALQESCRMKFGKEFEKLDWNEQTSLLETLEAGKMNEVQWNKGFDREFFNLVRDHSMQSYYGNPRHGGNKNNISYKMLKIDAPLIIGQNRYNG